MREPLDYGECLIEAIRELNQSTPEGIAFMPRPGLTLDGQIIGIVQVMLSAEPGDIAGWQAAEDGCDCGLPHDDQTYKSSLISEILEGFVEALMQDVHGIEAALAARDEAIVQIEDHARDIVLGAEQLLMDDLAEENELHGHDMAQRLDEEE